MARKQTKLELNLTLKPWTMRSQKISGQGQQDGVSFRVNGQEAIGPEQQIKSFCHSKMKKQEQRKVTKCMKNCTRIQENDFKRESQCVSRYKRKLQGKFGLIFSMTFKKTSQQSQNQVASEIREDDMKLKTQL